MSDPFSQGRQSNTLATSLVNLWSDLRNGLDLSLRNRLTWSPAAQEQAEGAQSNDPREPEWVSRYDLGAAQSRMTQGRWLRNLAVVEVLEHAMERSVLGPLLEGALSLEALDIGSKNFDYVDGLHGFLSRAKGRRTVDLTGIELDAHRRYTDFRTRRAWADHYCASVPGARFLPGDLEEHQGVYQVITWFFPFVTEFPLRRWGLPSGLFRPQALLDHAWDLLAPGGVLVIVNLNLAEATVQHELFRRKGLPFCDLGALPGSFGSRTHDQRVVVVSKA